MATYVLKVNGQPVDLAAARVSLEGLDISWKGPDELTFRQAKPHHQADFLEEDAVELEAEGDAVFRGRILERELRGEPGREFVAYHAEGLRALARRVPVLDPLTGVPAVTFNSPPPEEDPWQAGRTGFTCGEIVKWLIDSFAAELIAASVLREGGTHYLQSELDALDLVPPEVTFEEVSVDEAVETVLREQADHGYRIDPAGQTFRFLHLGALPELTVTIDQLPGENSDRVLANLLRPSTADCYTAYEIRGARQLTPALLYLSRGELEELWDPDLEASWSLPRAFSEYERRDAGTDPAIEADTLTDLSKNWTADEWVGGFLVEQLTPALGGALIRAYRVLANSATEVVVEGILLQPTEGLTVTYDLYAGVCPYRYVWSRYRIVDPAKSQVVRDIPPVFQVASGFFLSHPLVERKLTFPGGESWAPVEAQVFVDGSGVFLTATPLYRLAPGGSPLQPGEATGPEDVRFRLAYASGSLVARSPESGYTGTAYTQAGLRRTRVRYLPEFVLDTDVEQYRALAAELLAPLKDINYSGELPLASLRWDLAGLTWRVNVAARDRLGNPIPTGFEALAVPLARVRYDFRRGRSALLLATNIAQTIFGPEVLEEARARQWRDRLGRLAGRLLSLWHRLQVSIGHPTQNDGGARAGGDRGGEPGTTSSSGASSTTSEPATMTSEPPATTSELVTTTSPGSSALETTSTPSSSSEGPPPSTESTSVVASSTSEVPPLTTTSEALATTTTEAATTSGGTEIEHVCCPNGAPRRFGFAATGFTDTHGSDCTDLNTSGELVWVPEAQSWVFFSQFCDFSLACMVEHIQVGENTFVDLPKWTLGAHSNYHACDCSWASWLGGGDPPFSEGFEYADCGVSCEGGTFNEECVMGGGPDCAGSVEIWPI